MSWDPVYRLVKKIPRGRVTTYGEVAKALRLPGGARAVGYAMAATPNGRGIPWHRVLGAGGEIKLRGDSAFEQHFRLEAEGVTFRGRRVDMAHHEFKFPRGRTARSAKPNKGRKS